MVPLNIQSANSPIVIHVNGGTSPPGAFLATSGLDYEGSNGLGSIKIVPAAFFLGTGQKLPLSASVFNVVGFSLLPPSPLVWMSSNNQVATVSASGTVTGVSPGTATITAFLAGISGSATVTVTNP